MWRELMGILQDKVPAAKLQINHRNKGIVSIDDIPSMLYDCGPRDKIYIEIIMVNEFQLIKDEL